MFKFTRLENTILNASFETFGTVIEARVNFDETTQIRNDDGARQWWKSWLSVILERRSFPPSLDAAMTFLRCIHQRAIFSNRSYSHSPRKRNIEDHATIFPTQYDTRTFYRSERRKIFTRRIPSHVLFPTQLLHFSRTAELKINHILALAIYMAKVSVFCVVLTVRQLYQQYIIRWRCLIYFDRCFEVVSYKYGAIFNIIAFFCSSPPHKGHRREPRQS